MEIQEIQLKEAKHIAEDADRKYEEVRSWGPEPLGPPSPHSGPGVGDRSRTHTLAFFSETINSTPLAEMVVLRSRVPLSAGLGSYWILLGDLGFIMKPISSPEKDQSFSFCPFPAPKDQDKRSWPGGGSVASCVCGRSSPAVTITQFLERLPRMVPSRQPRDTDRVLTGVIDHRGRFQSVLLSPQDGIIPLSAQVHKSASGHVPMNTTSCDNSSITVRVLVCPSCTVAVLT